jgi:hypothetical protein
VGNKTGTGEIRDACTIVDGKPDRKSVLAYIEINLK